MKRTGVGFVLSALVAILLAVGSRRVGTQLLPAEWGRNLLTIAPSTLADVRAWDSELTRMHREGTLALVREPDDTLMPRRQHERFEQHHGGLRVFGAEVTRQSESGVPISMLGSLYRNIEVPTAAQLSPDQARRVMLGQPDAETIIGEPELLILPLAAGGLALAYRVVTTFPQDILVSFVDASSGRILMQHTDLQTQSGAGRGRGVLADTKKISTNQSGGSFQTSDGLRPPSILTYDLKGNLTRTLDVLNNRTTLVAADLATDADNDWTDGAVVDGHVYAGWTYDYYFKRFGRRGIDNNNLAIRSIIHPVSRDNYTTAYFNQNSTFFTNAFWSGSLRLMVYGVGLPPTVTLNGRNWNFTSGAIDIVAHELTHGVTQFSSNLTYRDESGALNEAFSDIMATGVEFFYQQAGNGSLRADYLAGEDVVSGGGIRSLADPLAFNHPDYYSLRYSGLNDSGGVHTNSGIANHAFYLAIEGGTNRTSGLAVQGVGGANREQIEKVFYRAFTLMLPASANFFSARVATIQAARDLYGANSAAERAVTQAWDAVGVRQQAATLFFFLPPTPVPPAPPGQCTLAAPNFTFFIGVGETGGVGITITSSQYRFYNVAGTLMNSQAFNFAQVFTGPCGAGSNRIPAGGRPCAQACVSLGGAARGFLDIVLTGTDDVGNQATFVSPRVQLGIATAVAADTPFEGMCMAMGK